MTKSVDGWVQEIDGKPALDEVAKYLGLTEVDEAHGQSVIVEMGVNHPFLFQRDNGDFVLRGGLVVDWQKRSFKCSGNVPEGSQFRFSLPADFNVIDSVIQGYEHLKATEMPEADALIMYSCLGRQMIFGPLMSKEVEGVYDVWNVPMAGFFCNGEIGRSRGGDLEHHAGTVVCAVLREKPVE
ncbi:MAG: FIST C-terminal domain-containing protein [Saprospiraceae bacterium]|nr:FIST C-terminal domain-containing protein [Saprospiraceae bacterium]